jgi:hypothetical protein
MISSIIVDILSKDVSLGLIKGVNLFAERASGNKYVLVSVTHCSEAIDDPVVKNASINILIYGYNVSEGMVLGRHIVKSLESLTLPYKYSFDESVYYSQFSDVVNYTLKGLKVTIYPILLNYSESFSINLEVVFSEE